MPTEVTVGLMGEHLGSGEGAEGSSPVQPVPRAASRHYQQLLREITGWARTNRDRVAKLYLSPERGDAVRVCVIARTPEYDFELARRLAEFIVVMAEKGFPLRGSQIPDGSPEELGAFFDIADSLVLSLD